MVGPSIDAWGGVATVEKNILEAVASTGREVVFVATMEDGSAFHKALVFVRALFEIRARLRCCDVCHVHTALGSSYKRKYLVCLQAKEAGVPYILHVHEGDFERQYEAMPSREQTKVKFMLTNASKVIALSDEWAAYFSQKFQLNNIVVLENAVFVPERVNEEKDPTKFLYLGSMCYRKGIDILLEAFARVVTSHPEAKLLLAGGGELLDEYKQLAKTLGLGTSVKFLGWADEHMRARLLDSCFVSILPSRAEGLPMCVLESMAAGCVPIATKVGGLPDLIDDGVNGILVDPDDSKTLAQKMIFCIRHQDMVRQLAENGRQTIVDRYSMAKYLTRLESLYENV